MTTLIREREHEPYQLATFLGTAKSDPWRAAKEIGAILLIFALGCGLLWIEEIAAWVERWLP